ncbi:unnamed protein product, partial [Ixodes pacificus]
CIVVLPRPEACVESFRILLLLLCGDVEQNPGPMSDLQAKQFSEMLRLLHDLNARSLKFEEGQNAVLSSINDLKANHESLQLSVTNLIQRVTVLESRTAIFDDMHRELVGAHQTFERIEKDSLQCNYRLNELEDRSRRDNLLFHGVDDAANESWTQAEEKVLSLLSNHLNVNISHEQIARAHRLGPFVDGKCRPLIVKFESFKIKEQVLSCRSGLKNAHFSIAEDFCPETRMARRQLLEYGKRQGAVFKLRYNKLFVNGKCFCYNSVNDCVYELPVKTVHRAHNRAQTLNSSGTAQPIP